MKYNNQSLVYVALLFSAFLLMFQSCNKHSRSSWNLERYYDSQHITETVKGNKYRVAVNQSKTVKKERKKLGDKWKNAESFASVGALMTLKTILDNDLSVDTVLIEIRDKNLNELYSYRVSDLIQADKYKKLAEIFLKLVPQNLDSLRKIKPYLGDDILNGTSDSELLNVLESGFLRVPINKFKFRGMTITGDILSMYIDTYYENGEAQTFILSYYMYQDDKLDGINIPVK